MRADTRTLEVGGLSIEVRLPERDSTDDPWLDWLRTGARAVQTVSEDFPVERVRVNLIATDTRGGAVSYGRLRRSLPPQIDLYVDPHASLAGLNRDWRGYHELAHLLIPFPGNRDIWFTEGLASYYQYLLQSRAGVIEPERAWIELLEGFERGHADPAGRNRALRQLSPDMWRQGAFRRVYWTGAAFFLRVDVALRTESRGVHSLDSTLNAFHRCCMGTSRRWSAASLIDRLGSLSIPEVWQREYLKTIRGTAEPRYDRALEALGIKQEAGRVRFDPAPGPAALRRVIAGPMSLRTGSGVVVVDGDNGKTSHPGRRLDLDLVIERLPEQPARER